MVEVCLVCGRTWEVPEGFVGSSASAHFSFHAAHD